MIRLLYLFGMCVLIRSIKTIQNITQNAGHRYFSAFLIGIDTLFFLLVFKNVITNTITPGVIVAVGSGYIVGFLLGTEIEDKIALGKVIVTIKIPKEDSRKLSKILKDNGFIFITSKRHHSHKGKAKKIHQGIIFRRELPKLKKITADLNIIATVENIKSIFGKKLASAKEILER